MFWLGDFLLVISGLMHHQLVWEKVGFCSIHPKFHRKFTFFVGGSRYLSGY